MAILLMLPLVVAADTSGCSCEHVKAELKAELRRELRAELLHDLRTEFQQPHKLSLQQSVRVSATGDASVDAGRRLTSDSMSCCRWTHNEACGSSIAAGRYEKCTSLHEYLEGKTTTHELMDVDACLGSDASAWGWNFDSPEAVVTLSSGGSEAGRVPTPIKVTHAATCGGKASMELQLNTSVAHLNVLNSLVVNGVDMTSMSGRVNALEAAVAAMPAPSPCPSASWGKGTAVTLNNPYHQSSSQSGHGPDYGATHTIDGDYENTFWLSDASTPTNQWIVYEFGNGNAADAEYISGIKIRPGQDPYGVKDFAMQTSDSVIGPWTEVGTGSAPACNTAGVNAGTCDTTLSWAGTKSQYWRLAGMNSQSGVARPKIMEVDFNVCSS